MSKRELYAYVVFTVLVFFYSFFSAHVFAVSECDKAGGMCFDLLDNYRGREDALCKIRGAQRGYVFTYDSTHACEWATKPLCCKKGNKLPPPSPTHIPTPTVIPTPSRSQITYYPAETMAPAKPSQDERCSSYGPSYTRACCRYDSLGCVAGESKITWYGCLKKSEGDCSSLNATKEGRYDDCVDEVNPSNPTKECNVDTDNVAQKETSVIIECEAFYDCHLNKNQTKRDCLKKISKGEAYARDGNKTSCSKCFYGGFGDTMCCWDCK